MGGAGRHTFPTGACALAAHNGGNDAMVVYHAHGVISRVCDVQYSPALNHAGRGTQWGRDRAAACNPGNTTRQGMEGERGAVPTISPGLPQVLLCFSPSRHPLLPSPA
jgi:hypothetical protein